MPNPDYDTWLLSGPGGPNDDWPTDAEGVPLTEEEISQREYDAAVEAAEMRYERGK